MPEQVLVTGSSGFIGQHWLRKSSFASKARPVSLQSTTPAAIDFSGIDSVLHLAGIAHRMDQPSGPIYYEVNRDLTLELARAARESGVKHFLFVSTVKVYGDRRDQLSLDDRPEPEDDYGQSKWEAEQALLDMDGPSFRVAILRPPLVYGPGVKGNVQRLLQLLEKGWPLPFKNIPNQRSMVFVDNLTAMLDCIIAQRARGVYIAGDREPLSTASMICYLSEGLGKKVHLFSIPKIFRILIYKLKPDTARRLFGSYVIDATTSMERLHFTPPYSSQEGLQATGSAFALQK